MLYLFFFTSVKKNIISSTNISILLCVILLDEVEHYSVRQFEDYGVDSDEFIYSTLITFRKTVYVTKMNAKLSSGTADRLGRASVDKISSKILMDRNTMTLEKTYNVDVASKIMIIDRSGYFGQMLAQGKNYAVKGQSMSITVSPVMSPLLQA